LGKVSRSINGEDTDLVKAVCDPIVHGTCSSPLLVDAVGADLARVERRSTNKQGVHAVKAEAKLEPPAGEGGELIVHEPVLARWGRLVTLVMDEDAMGPNRLNTVWVQSTSWVRKIQMSSPNVDIWAVARQTHRRTQRRISSAWPGGVPTDLAEEQQRDTGFRAFLEEHIVVRPHCPSRICWACCGVLLMLFDLIVLPLQAFHLPSNLFFIGMLWFSQVFWTLDLVSNFFTGIYLDSELVRDIFLIARNYATTWLLFDLSVVVFMWFETAVDSDTRLGDAFRYIRTVRYLRLLRLAKIEVLLRDALVAVNSPVLLLLLESLKLLLCLIFVSHVNACLWFYVGQLDATCGWTQLVADEPILYQYLTSMHWVMTQFQGTSEILPGKTVFERGYAVMVVLISVLVLSTFVSSLTNIIMQLNNMRMERSYQKRMVCSYLSQHRISSALSIRVKKYIEWKQKMQRQIDHHQQALKFLPTTLQMDLVVEVRMPLFCHHEFLGQFVHIYPRLSRRIFHDAFHHMTPAPEEIIFSSGETCSRMYFVESGKFDYIVRDRVEGGPTAIMGQHKILKDQYVSEPCLWMLWQHRGDLICDGVASLLTLSPQIFGKIIATHPQAHVSSVLYAHRYIAGMARFRWSCTDMVKPGTLIRDDANFEDILAHSFSAVVPLCRGSLRKVSRRSISHPGSSPRRSLTSEQRTFSSVTMQQNWVGSNNGSNNLANFLD